MKQNNRFSMPEPTTRSVRPPCDIVGAMADKSVGCFLQAVVVELGIGPAEFRQIEARYRGLCVLHGIAPSF